jgi:hypothetical protein
VPAGGGAATLARLSGARVLPVVASVGFGGRVRAAVAPAVEVAAPRAHAAAFEEELEARVHEAFERLLDADPAARFERLRWAVRIGTWRSARDPAVPAPAEAPA